MWILECHKQEDVNVTVWSSKPEALAAACTDILSLIMREWNMSHAPYKKVADEINNFVIAGQYHAALFRWNDCTENTLSTTPWFWYVYQRDIQTFTGTVTPLSSSFLNMQPNPVTVVPTPPAKVYSKPTCRGCWNENEYAQADRNDNTFVCFACKSMSTLYNNPIK